MGEGGDVPEPLDRLYTSADLFRGWEADRPLSAGETFDFATYVAARRQGKAALRSPPTREVARARAVHDGTVSWHLHERLVGHRVVAVMGGHRLARNSVGYRMVAELTHQLAEAGFLVLSGGGPGAMEAAHLGARVAGPGLGLGLEAALALMGADRADGHPDDGTLAFPFDSADELFVDGRSDRLHEAGVELLHRWQAPAFALAAGTATGPGPSIGIPTWLYGHEPPTPLATEHAKYFDNSIREDGLLAVATSGVVFAPGKAGTLQEIFQDAAQNYYESVADRFSPMVFLDVDGYWTGDFDVRSVLNRLFDADQRSNLHWVTSARAALDALVAADQAHGPPR